MEFEISGSTCEFIADVDSPTLTVKFAKVRATVMGLLERLDDHDQGPDGMFFYLLRSRFRIDRSIYLIQKQLNFRALRMTTLRECFPS